MQTHSGKRLLNTTVFIILVLAAIAFLAPFVWMVSTSLKPLNETMTLPPRWIPSVIQWHNYRDAIDAMGYFWRYLGNSLFLCVMTVVGTVTSSALAAYGFSRIEWKGRDKVFLILLATMMIPFPVIMVPIYSLFKSLGWIGSFKPLWAPSFLAGAFNVFLLRQFFLSLPKDMSEAARIDGCNEFQIFWRIVLPLCKPALLVVAIFQFMATWNDFLGPLIFLTEQKDYTLALGLQSFQSQQGGTAWHQLMAASTLVVLPVIAIFFFAQRTFIEGIASTGAKN
jgi:multiple sugar transport system permease protein